jgi:hypothetical protein
VLLDRVVCGWGFVWFSTLCALVGGWTGVLLSRVGLDGAYVQAQHKWVKGGQDRE